MIRAVFWDFGGVIQAIADLDAVPGIGLA